MVNETLSSRLELWMSKASGLTTDKLYGELWELKGGLSGLGAR